jgi:hypothetical protein
METVKDRRRRLAASSDDGTDEEDDEGMRKDVVRRLMLSPEDDDSTLRGSWIRGKNGLSGWFWWVSSRATEMVDWRDDLENWSPLMFKVKQCDRWKSR